jgi:hypothetical protein
MSLDPSARTLRARIGAYAQHAKHDIGATTEAGRRAADRRFYDQVDRDRALPEAERERRAHAARQAYMLGLAFRSAQARKAGKRQPGGASDAVTGSTG